MKKTIVILLAFSMMISFAVPGVAEDNQAIDLSGYSFQELVALRQQIDAQLTQIATNVDHSGYSLDGLVYVSNGSEVHIKYYDGSNPNVIIPAEIDGLPVTEIHTNAFQKNNTINSVVVSEGITKIPEKFLFGCDNLTSVTLPEGILEIPSECFAYSDSLREISIPKSVKKIGDNIIEGTKVDKITLPEGIEEIGSSFFDANYLSGVIVLPSTLKSLGDFAFGICYHVSGFIVQSDLIITKNAMDCYDSQFIYVKEGCNVRFENEPFNAGLKIAVLPASVTSIGNEVFTKCNRLTIVCPPGSYAESYAKQHFIMCDTEHYDQYVQEYDAQYLNNN